MPYAKSFKEASEKYRQKGIRFFDMNYDENKEIIDMLVRDHIFSEDIGGVPCTIFIRDGKEFYRVRGAKPDKLEQGIEKYF